ncbi:MAG: hypothetical protein FJ118_19915 [Deltaproteobacteria bacterium]|nr:hypothetical protein [Deltaproteobacteria bacterium]
MTPIVVRCSHCGGLMKVDRDAITVGGSVRVRCPHCEEVGWVRDASDGRETKIRGPGPSAALSSHAPATLGEPDYADDYRFPVEQEAAASQRSAMALRARILVWLVLSLGVIVIFAFLVNLILPGPPR